ncbi:Tim44/TimA family putative adaptor protein [Lyticum sinuosum]|uniref:Tim44-like domain protein n=1 Tax=Lyticum sinuosum TaxID=1332059 RepID=A0AAE4VM17_9RICK|nr:Tim44/TimA family putative adaptor protein [Lyticum sinuosum]MDZ5761351.1 Tim44-like domain protein [Lyticum sinuosum]
MIDLIILCVATFFIINKFIDVLGKTDSNDQNRRGTCDIKWQNFFKVNDAQNTNNTSETSEIKDPEPINAEIISVHEANLPYPIRNIIKEIMELDKSFTLDSFIRGVNRAFITIINAFTNGDCDTLKELLEDNVYQSFSNQINNFKIMHQTVEQKVINIRQINIDNAFIDQDNKDNKIKINVTIISDQIYVLRNSDGNIMDGNPVQTERITDTWSFIKRIDVNSINIWKLANTK